MSKSSQMGPGRLVASSAVGAVWWYFLIRGLLILAAGVFVLLKPEQTAKFFALLVGALVLIDGALAAGAGIMGRAESRVWSLARGVLMVLIGLFVLFKPDLVATFAMKTIFFVVGPIIIVAGLLETISCVRARKKPGPKEGSLFGGVLTIVFGTLLIVAPLFFGVLLIRFLAAAAILFAIGLLYLARKFRKLRKRIEATPS